MKCVYVFPCGSSLVVIIVVDAHSLAWLLFLSSFLLIVVLLPLIFHLHAPCALRSFNRGSGCLAVAAAVAADIFLSSWWSALDSEPLLDLE
mmetsp:Transcript_39823/g.73462  ORF Transcript_39823/g.73462 Transcript_39823/m.73462 type:complete len:91 (+) Transcript_39823:49-321(+)